MRIYEELFIIKPELPEEEIDAFIEQLTGNIGTAGGTVDKVEKWGKRRLAYPVEKFKDGSYVLMQFSFRARSGQGSRAPPPRCRPCNQVPDRTH